MSPRSLAVALLLAPAFLSLLPLADAQTPSAFTVNVLSARSLGCASADQEGPDLRVVVLLNDAPLLVTPISANRHEAVFAERADASAVLPARITLRVDDEQPPARAGGPAYFDACDVGAGEGDWHNLTYHGGAGERIVARGEGPDAAEVVLVLGTGAPSSPAAGVVGVQPSTASLMWDRSRGAAATGYRVSYGGVGHDVSFLPADALSATLGGICDNHPYSVRVLRDSPPWLLTSPDVTFTTPNLAPQPARVLRADPAGSSLHVAWESVTLHDVGRFEVHAGPAPGFTATADTLRGTVNAPFTQAGASLDVPRRAEDAYVRVRTVDVVGALAVSEPFAIGTAALAPAAATENCAPVQVDAPGAVAAPEPVRPVATKPAEGTDGGVPTSPSAPADPSIPATVTTPATGQPGTTVGASKEDTGGASTPLGPVPALLALAGAAALLARRRR